jgi:hypothetical protein
MEGTKHSSDYITCLLLWCESYRHDKEATNVSFINIISPCIISQDRYSKRCDILFYSGLAIIILQLPGMGRETHSQTSKTEYKLQMFENKSRESIKP